MNNTNSGEPDTCMRQSTKAKDPFRDTVAILNSLVLLKIIIMKCAGQLGG